MPETPAVVTPTPPPVTTPPVETNGVTPPEGTPPPDTKPKEDPMGKRFAALSRKEKEILNERQAIAAEKAAVEADKARMQKIVTAVANAKANPMALLTEAGVTYDELTRYILNDGKPSPEDRIAELDNKLEEERRARISAEEKRELERQQADEAYITKMIDDYRKETNDHIASNPEAYESIIAYDAQDEVFSAIRDHFAETGKILSPEEAAKQVEAELDSIIEKTLKLNKVQAKLKPPEPEPKKTTAEPPKTTRTPPKTLSTSHVSSPTPKKETVSLDKNERLKRAMEKLVFTDR